MRLTENYDVHVIEFTHGERGLGEAGYRDGSTKKLRTAEDEAVCRALGIPLHWCEAIDGEAFAGRKECEQIAGYYRQIKPRAIIVHSLIETHYDHMMSAAAAIKATQLAGIRPEIYFQEQDIQSRAFQIEYWVDVSKQTARKREIISLWACQDGPAIAARKIKTSEVNAMRMRNLGATNVEVFGAFPGTIPLGKGIFDQMSGVMR
jgi:LmbE family N-acetylglucosaminyl deacetylase